MISPSFLLGHWQLFRLIKMNEDEFMNNLQFFQGEATVTQLTQNSLASHSYQQTTWPLTLLSYQEHTQNKSNTMKASQSYLYAFKEDELIIEFPFDHFYSKFTPSDLVNENFNFTNPLAHFKQITSLNDSDLNSPVHYCNEDIYQYHWYMRPAAHHESLLNRLQKAYDISLLSCLQSTMRFGNKTQCNDAKAFDNESQKSPLKDMQKETFIQEVSVTGPNKNYTALTLYVKTT